MDILTTVMSATNQNQEIDSLQISQNTDGSFTLNWDKNDPTWSWLNQLTSAQIQVIMEQAIKEYCND
jgi:hypothetical protein